MGYKEEITKAMTMLGKDERTIFLGQSILYPGHVMYGTLSGVPDSKKIEMPVAEDMQMGISIGLALKGYIPISIYPRMDFLILAMNQLVNHLDKIEEMSEGQFKPRVIIRTMVGSKEPMNPGVQHCQDYTEALSSMLKNIEMVSVIWTSDPHYILEAYINSLDCNCPRLLIEYGDLYD